MATIGTEGLGEVAKQIKEGAMYGYEASEKEKAAKKREDATKNWLEKHWKKLVALGIITPIAGYGAIQGFKLSQSVQGITSQVSQGLSAFASMLGKPMEAISGIMGSLDQLNLSNIKMPDLTALEFPKLIPDLPALTFPEFSFPEFTLPSLEDLSVNTVSNLGFDESNILQSLESLLPF